MPKADVETLLTARGNWSEHRHLLDRVIGSSGTCRHMFAFVRAMVVQELVDDVMGKTHGSLQNMQRLPSESVNEGVADQLSAISNIDGSGDVPVRRVVVIHFRSCEISVQIGSSREDLDLRVAAEVKTRGVLSGKLTPLKFESQLVDGAGRTKETEIDDDLLENAKVARDTANEMFRHGQRDGRSHSQRHAGQQAAGFAADRQDLQARGVVLASMQGAGREEVPVEDVHDYAESFWRSHQRRVSSLHGEGAEGQAHQGDRPPHGSQAEARCQQFGIHETLRELVVAFREGDQASIGRDSCESWWVLLR